MSKIYVPDGLYETIITEKLTREEGLAVVAEATASMCSIYKEGESITIWSERDRALLHVIGQNQLCRSSTFKSMLEDLEVSLEVVSRAHSILGACLSSTSRLDLLTRLQKFFKTLTRPVAEKGLLFFERLVSVHNGTNPEEEETEETDLMREIIAKALTQTPENVDEDLVSDFASERFAIAIDAFKQFLKID